MKSTLAFFHYCLFLAVPVFLIMLLDGVLWPAFFPNLGPKDALGLPVLIVLLTLLASLLVFVIRLSLDAGYREACFNRLAGVRERDEREERIVGAAARQTFLLSLGLLVALFVASLFDVSFNEQGLQGITMDHRRAELVVLPWTNGNDTVFKVMPLTKSGIFVFMVVLQIGAFRYFSLRAARSTK